MKHAFTKCVEISIYYINLMGTSTLITPHVNIFFRPGETYKETLNINGECVSGIPDVRFIAHHNSKVVAVTEVRRFEIISILKYTIIK